MAEAAAVVNQDVAEMVSDLEPDVHESDDEPRVVPERVQRRRGRNHRRARRITPIVNGQDYDDTRPPVWIGRSVMDRAIRTQVRDEVDDMNHFERQDLITEVDRKIDASELNEPLQLQEIEILSRALEHKYDNLTRYRNEAVAEAGDDRASARLGRMLLDANQKAQVYNDIIIQCAYLLSRTETPLPRAVTNVLGMTLSEYQQHQPW